jgi:hypothetical protein
VVGTRFLRVNHLRTAHISGGGITSPRSIQAWSWGSNVSSEACALIPSASSSEIGPNALNSCRRTVLSPSGSNSSGG